MKEKKNIGKKKIDVCYPIKIELKIKEIFFTINKKIRTIRNIVDKD